MPKKEREVINELKGFLKERFDNREQGVNVEDIFIWVNSQEIFE